MEQLKKEFERPLRESGMWFIMKNIDLHPIE